jgi:hypothetical protein
MYFFDYLLFKDDGIHVDNALLTDQAMKGFILVPCIT